MPGVSLLHDLVDGGVGRRIASEEPMRNRKAGSAADTAIGLERRAGLPVLAHHMTSTVGRIGDDRVLGRRAPGNR